MEAEVDLLEGVDQARVKREAGELEMAVDLVEAGGGLEAALAEGRETQMQWVGGKQVETVVLGAEEAREVETVVVGAGEVKGVMAAKVGEMVEI
mmetsp:Transcript_21175/g.50540  ORF Transcript_21175/g.50540 Transcript_21175/m.50540 type:complete len:94 (+) Transcript_21175:162-443(+)